MFARDVAYYTWVTCGATDMGSLTMRARQPNKQRLPLLMEKEMDYKKKRWQRKRQIILRMDGYRDRVAARYGRNIEANTVHHIYPVDAFPEYAWCDWNLISVSQDTHNKLHNRETGELTAEGLRLMRATKPGENWRQRSGSRI